MSTMVLCANRLDTGTVVYLSPATRWSADIDDAVVTTTDEARQAIDTRLANGEADVEVVGAEWILVDAARKGETTTVFPTRLREQIRQAGPSINYRGAAC